MIGFDLALRLHTMLTRATGGDDGLRDSGLLDGALSMPYQTFGKEELYPTVEEKAARLGYSLIKNHAFVDGNKRIGMFLLLIFLRLSGIDFTPEVSEVSRVGFSVAKGEMTYEDLLLWIKNNM